MLCFFLVLMVIFQIEKEPESGYFASKMLHFQIENEQKWCKMQPFRGFTIGKVIIGRFSNRK